MSDRRLAARVGQPLPAGTGVVYFGNDWNAENRTSSHHVARRLAERVPVLYVDSPGMRPPSGSGRDVRRAIRKLLQALAPPRQVLPGLWHATIPQLPWRSLRAVAWLNLVLGRWALRRAVRRAGIAPSIFWFVVPHPAALTEALAHELLVYYCIDDYAAHPGVDVASIEACDARLTLAADLIFVASPTLLEAKRGANPATYFAPHGVDTALFARAQDPGTLPALPDIRHPVVGYFGLIGAWTDVGLVEALARARPTWTFLLVGHSAVDISALAALPNVVLVGPQPYESLPNWARCFDVALIPYLDNRQVRNANPLKLREYLATGKPVVSLATPEVDRFAHVVRTARGALQFLERIEEALAERDDGAARARMASVSDMSWDRRVDETLDVVAAEMERKRRRASIG